MAVLITKLIGLVPIDVVISEEHTSDMTLSENPIEFGATIADHARLEPKSIVINGAIGRSDQGLSSILGSGTPNLGVEAMGAYSLLIAQQKLMKPFTIISGLRIYQNMMITSLTSTRDVDSANHLNFSCTCREVQIVGVSLAETKRQLVSAMLATAAIIAVGVARRAATKVGRSDTVTSSASESEIQKVGAIA